MVTRSYDQINRKDSKIREAAKNLGAFTPEEFEGFPEHQVVLTRVAVDKVSDILEREGRLDLKLRVSCQPGGCSGITLQIFADDRILDGDAIMTQGDLDIIVDRMSQPYLNGAVISHEDSLEKQGFVIDNPNAQGTCSCGDSFH